MTASARAIKLAGLPIVGGICHGGVELQGKRSHGILTTAVVATGMATAIPDPPPNRRLLCPGPT
jgi:hypothetical protein